jgi:hypothetical protein
MPIDENSLSISHPYIVRRIASAHGSAYRNCASFGTSQLRIVRHIATAHRSRHRICASFLLGTVQGSAIRNYDGNRWDFGEVISFPGASKLRDARFPTLSTIRVIALRIVGGLSAMRCG